MKNIPKETAQWYLTSFFPCYTGSGPKCGKWDCFGSVFCRTASHSYDNKLDCSIIVLHDNLSHHFRSGWYNPNGRMEAWNAWVTQPDSGCWFSCWLRRTPCGWLRSFSEALSQRQGARDSRSRGHLCVVGRVHNSRGINFHAFRENRVLFSIWCLYFLHHRAFNTFCAVFLYNCACANGAWR